MVRRIPAAILTLGVVCALLASACGGSSSTDPDEPVVQGIVTEVTGGIDSVSSFVVMDDNGDLHEFTPEPGLLFYGGPLSHLRDHIVTGERVKVTYEEGPGGNRIAVLVEHADGEAPHESSEDHDH
ncbi:MAG: hypothetical protein KDB69_03640 [Acidimicrobiia bacterium]|nr:hypothetical protein [Acidimicrobiia bacterium]